MMVTVRPATAIRLVRYFNSATRMESAGVNLAWLGINATGRDLVWLVVQFNKFVFFRCADNHFDFTKTGCKSCGCSVEGSASNTPQCDPVTGICLCKDNVEGRQCKECKPGYFNLDLDNEFGCTPCFCYGHSSECKSAPGAFISSLSGPFELLRFQAIPGTWSSRRLPKGRKNGGRRTTSNDRTKSNTSQSVKVLECNRMEMSPFTL